ncbi:hypothetical protein [Clostridium sp. OS1-26]|uniref:hypothetical protein n=1 Tax=Clostridium sp. OS1-26 TaxID=3070681 RepID=UPI0027E092EF|nr:hypothetical protein [Clostridium sp. OS1-26]WML37459.1 hypothetical protein RCG18_13085 [Clostridium sp. OS1-26]
MSDTYCNTLRGDTNGENAEVNRKSQSDIGGQRAEKGIFHATRFHQQAGRISGV